MPKAIAYCRVSTDEQSKTGLSLDQQATTATKYADLHGYTLEIIRDEGRSGKNWKRDGARVLWEKLENGEVDHLIVHRIDRLSRNALDLLMIEEKLREKSVRFHSIQECINTESPYGRFIYRILAAKAELDLDMIREWTRIALARKRDQGIHTGRAGYGYKVRKGHLVEVGGQQTVIAKALELRELGYTWREVAARVGVPKNTIIRAVEKIQTREEEED